MLITTLLAVIVQTAAPQDLAICAPLRTTGQPSAVATPATGGSGSAPTFKVPTPSQPVLIHPTSINSLYYPDIAVIEWALPIDTASTGAVMRRFSPRPLGTLPFTRDQTSRFCILQLPVAARRWTELVARLDTIAAMPGVRSAKPLYYSDRLDD